MWVMCVWRTNKGQGRSSRVKEAQGGSKRLEGQTCVGSAFIV